VVVIRGELFILNIGMGMDCLGDIGLAASYPHLFLSFVSEDQSFVIDGRGALLFCFKLELLFIMDGKLIVIIALIGLSLVIRVIESRFCKLGAASQSLRAPNLYSLHFLHCLCCHYYYK
jgi:hypothetical protein